MVVMQIKIVLVYVVVMLLLMNAMNVFILGIIHVYKIVPVNGVVALQLMNVVYVMVVVLQMVHVTVMATHQTVQVYAVVHLQKMSVAYVMVVAQKKTLIVMGTVLQMLMSVVYVLVQALLNVIMEFMFVMHLNVQIHVLKDSQKIQNIQAQEELMINVILLNLNIFHLLVKLFISFFKLRQMIKTQVLMIGLVHLMEMFVSEQGNGEIVMHRPVMSLYQGMMTPLIQWGI